MAGRDELKSLHTALIDARTGYEAAIKAAETPELKAIFQEMHDLHGRGHGVVHQALRRMGETPDKAGSFMSTVHETVIGVRAAVVGLDAGSLSSFASGEENTLAKYNDAIRALGSGPDATSLSGLRDDLAGAIARMESRSTS